MTVDRRFERHLPEILEDLYLGPSPTYRDEVLATAVRSRQRPAWTFPGRWLPVEITTRITPVTRLPLRQIGVLALIALLIAAALAVALGSQRHLPAPFGPARNGLISYISSGDIYVGDPTAGRSRLLMRSPDGQGALAPGFSPDGTQLAFLRPVKAGAGATSPPVDLYVMRDDGTNVTKVTTTPITSQTWVNWAPDSRHFVVIEPIDGTNQIELLDADAKAPPVRLPTTAIPDQVAFRPPLGNEMLFRGLVDGKYGLFVMNVDGSNVRTLVTPANPAEVDQDLNAVTYSADGSRIFYQRWFPDSIQLWVMNADGSEPHEFYPEPGPGWDGIPTPSPDGRWVAYWHVIQDDRNGQPGAGPALTVARADGTGPLIGIGPQLAGNARWTWSPDSTKILMMPDDGSSLWAYLLDPGGGPWTTVPWRSDLDIDWQRLAP